MAGKPRKKREIPPDQRPSFAGPFPTDALRPNDSSDDACTKNDASGAIATKSTVMRHAWVKPLLVHLRSDPSMARAARAAGIDRTTVYRAMDRNAQLARKVKRAVATGRRVRVQDLDDEVYTRGKDGWLENVYQGGIKVGTRRKFSDQLAIKYLECNSKRYAKRSESTVTSVSVAFTVDARNRLLSDPLARELACALAEQLAQPKAIEASGSVSPLCGDSASDGTSA